MKKILYGLALTCLMLTSGTACKKETTEIPAAPTKGTGTFWMATDLGTITVRCNGETSSIYNVYSSKPDCGAAGCANFDLPKGTHSFSASNTTGIVWSGSITINPGFCALMQLTPGGG